MKWVRDLRKPARNKDISKFPSAKNGETIMCESVNELDCCYWLEYASNVISYESQPLGFTYQLDGKERSYTPDFLIVDSLQNKTYIEVKSIDMLLNEDFRLEHKAKKESLNKAGYQLILVTDKQLQAGNYLKNCKKIHRYNGKLRKNDTMKLIQCSISKTEKITSSALAERLDIPVQEIFVSVLGLLASRELGADLLIEEISENTLIWSDASFPIQIRDDYHDINYLKLELNNSFDLYKRMRYTSLSKINLIEPDLAAYPAELQDQAIERYKLLCLIINELNGGWTPANLNPLIDRFIEQVQLEKPSYKSIVRWHKTFINSDGKITSLISKHGKKGNRKNKISGDEKYYEQAKDTYLSAEKPTIFAAYQFYKDQIEVNNENVVFGQIPTRSYKSFREKIKKLSPYEVTFNRRGKYFADKEFCFKHAIKMPTRILERVEIDHSPLDLILLDDEYLIPLGRAYLTLAVDVFSGCIIGFHLGFEPPSYDSAAKTIINSVKKKDYVAKLPVTLTNDWLCHGKIENLVVDNGAEFLSKSLENACLSNGINIIQNQVRKPWMKPFVERKFRSVIQGIVGWIPGKTFSNILEKEDYKPEKDAVMRFSVFVQELHRWVIDVHNANADSRSQRIPNLFWKNSYAQLPPRTLSETEEKSFIVSMGMLHKGTLTKRGIQYRHLTYDSKALAQYRATYPQTKESKVKTVKINPDNLASIYIYLEELEVYIEVPSRDQTGYTHGLCLSLHKKLVKAHKTYIKGNIDTIALAKARLALHEAILAEKEHVKLSNKKHKLEAAKKIARAEQISSTSVVNKIENPTKKVEVKKTPALNEKPSKAEDPRERWNRIKSEMKS